MKKKTVFLHFILIFWLPCLAPAQALETASAPEALFEPMPEAVPLVRRPVPPRERTEYFWQPLRGFSSVTISVENSNNDFTSLGSGGGISTTAQQTMTYSLTYSYGLTKNWSISADFSTSPNQTQVNAAGTETDTSTGGPNNVELTLKNTTPLGHWNLHFGLKASYSLDVDQPASASSQGNNYSGGDSVTPYLGTSYNVFGKSFLGLRAEYIYNAARTVDPNRGIANARQKTGSNQALGAAFFEWHVYPFVFNVSGSYNWTDAGQTVIQTSLENVDPYTAIVEDIGLQFYFNKYFTARIDGILIQVSQIESSVSTQNSHTESEGTFTLRDEF